MKKFFNKFNQRTSLMFLSFLFLLFCALTFTFTLGQRNDPTLIYVNDKLSGVIDNVVHVNDLDADFYYLKGKNYTESPTGTLPTGDYQSFHPDNRLVEVQLTYSGVDSNNGLRGYVSLGELQDTYIYYKIFPVNENGTPANTTDDYIEIELIENPFTNRPTNRGFNGWKTSYSGAEISFDRDYYIRRAKVPVSYNAGKPNKVTISFDATWALAATSLVNSTTTWATAFGAIDNAGMKAITTVTGQNRLPFDMAGYFKEVTVNQNSSIVGYYDRFGNQILNSSNPSYCIEWTVPVGAEAYDENGVLQITQAGSGNVCYKKGMIVFKTATSYSNIITSGGNFDTLVVAGGGSGARSSNTTGGGGGGGAGGLILSQSRYINMGTHSLSVGAGGIANPVSGANDGRLGANSSAFGLTAIGGGGGGANSRAGLLGGSGGGGGSRGGSGGSATSGQGNIGGNGNATATGDNAGGGGGGYSQAGGNGILNTTGGFGGNGYNGTTLFGTSVGANGWFAAGGGGGISGNRTAGPAGTGGGGTGGVNLTPGQSATPNTGSGGGGSPRSNYTAGDGGSGVVIVSWDETIQTNVCGQVGGCTYYELISSENYQDATTYYQVSGDLLQAVNPASIPFSYEPIYAAGLTSSSNMSTYYRLLNIPRYSSINGYYDNLGSIQSGTCNTVGGCNLYQLIQYRNSSNQEEIIDPVATYYQLATRDTNILIMTTNLATTWAAAQNKPFTLTSVHNGTDYRGSVLWTVNLAVTAYADTNIENIRMTTTENVNITTPPTNATTTRIFYGWWKNIRFGRGITQSGVQTNFRTIIGGSNAAVGAVGNITHYRMIVESGRYSTMSIANSGGTANTYIESKAIYGNDYDRVSLDNTRLFVNFVASGSWGGNVYSSSNTAPIFDLTVKSGNFGGGKSDHTTGIYVGGRGGGTHYGPRVAKIEGGITYNLIGGPLTASSKENLNDTYISMTGGEVDVIIGGAGTSATYGNRILQVTGGRVNYSVFGGSNAYNGAEGDGTIQGSSFVYIGGIAVIGNPTLVSGNNTIWGAEAGSVFGLGNGRSGFSTIGSNKNSYVFIHDEADINRNVYGGGNFGAAGVSSSAATTSSTIKQLGGTIDGSVYGGGNNNGAGSATVSSTINIRMEEGIVSGSIYGGSNTLGIIYGSTNLNIIDGTVSGSVYGGGRGGYSSVSAYGTYVRNNSNVIIGDGTSTPIITQNVFGGSAFGSVNTINRTITPSNDTTNVTFNSGTISGDIFGGGQGDGTFSPYVAGNIFVNINNGTVRNIYGGNDQNGNTFRDAVINLSGGNATTSYGGGNRVNANTVTTNLQGTTLTTIYGGSNQLGTVTRANINTTSGSVSTIYGGNNQGGTTTESHINSTGATISAIYGGGRLAATGNTNVTINGVNVANVYGGGENANVTNTNMNLSNSTITNLFGGSNQGGTVTSSTIVSSANVSFLYGGNNAAGTTTTTNVTINNGTINTLCGGGKTSNSTNTALNINNGNLTYVYGGGENGNASTGTTVNVTGGTIESIYGGSNYTGSVGSSNMTISGATITNLYGGNSAGGTTTATTVTINSGNITNVYGGGRLANGTTTVLNLNGGTLTSVYGGALNANVSTSTSINLDGSTITDLFGGSNQSGNIGTATIITNSGTTSYIYGGNNQGGTVANTNVTISGGTHGSVYGGGYSAGVTNSTTLNIRRSTGALNNIYGGGRSASVPTTNVIFNGGTANNLFGGSNQSGNITTANITVNYVDFGGGTPTITNVYGGNNQGGTVGTTNLTLGTANLGNVYGGGNEAYVNLDTTIDINGTNLSGVLFGGGNNGGVGGDASTTVTNAAILGSVHAGGNGATAIVLGNTTLSIDGTSHITGSVFGGGNAAETGTSGANNSAGVVTISGGTILGNVYGGANTSVLYGTAEVNIGFGISGGTLIERDIRIEGTVFGGGEANASGSEVYDFSFISVTNGIEINIIGNATRDITILGSIFGSGNASSTTGFSSIYLNKYGKKGDNRRSISIQRTNLLVLDNSYVEVFGATDRTNEYSTTLFSLSRIDELKLKNNSSIYLENGANLLRKVFSGVDISTVETKGQVTINGSTVTKNVDNRIYMKEGKNLNIATNESVTAFGQVSGMSFFGMYTRDGESNVVEAYFSPDYEHGDTVAFGEFYHFSSGSYVLGRHELNHDIKVDGFYSNYQNEENENNVDQRYIVPTPENSNYYIWSIGETVASYDISLSASKYSTLGTYELPLLDYFAPNTSFTIAGVNFSELAPGVELVRQSQIPRIATDGKADTRMSMVMKTSNVGWITVGETNFLSEESNPIFGTKDLLKENSNIVPTLLFYVYHSKNLSSTGPMGTVVISLIATTPISDLENRVERININVALSRVIYTTNDYEGAMTAGEQHDIFVTTSTDVTAKSKLSAYFSLYSEVSTPLYQAGDYRTLVSSYVLPANTKITMIDLIPETPVYYYYIVSAADVTAANAEFALQGEATYPLSRFVRMGSTSATNRFDDAVQNVLYYDSTEGIVHEEFVFNVDFLESGINSDKLNNSLLMELRDSGFQTKINVLGIQHLNMTYNLHGNRDAVIQLGATLNKTNIYVGDNVNLDILTNFTQQIVDSRVVQDTTFYNQKLGVKLTILDSNDLPVNGLGLFGLYYRVNGVNYFPQMDGTARINLAPRIANIASRIVINTGNSKLATGNYKLKVESFGSADGIYYGLTSSDTETINFSILNNIYGLNVTLNEEAWVINKADGLTNLKNNALVFGIDFSSGLSNPNLRVSLKRRSYSTVNSNEYNPVDLRNYFTGAFVPIGDESKLEFVLNENPLPFQTYFLYTRNNLVSGTYKVVFSVYDGNNYIGEVFNYVIIK